MRRGERFNSISHLVGAILALAGLAPLVMVAAEGGDTRRITSFAVFGTTLLLLYLASTLYHSIGGPSKAVFRRLDHAAIYLLIAGTYTPFTLVTLGGDLGWTLFAAVWSLAVLGVVHASVRSHRSGMRSQVALCLAMGWIIVFALDPLMKSLPEAGVAWLFAGGLSYTVGVIFFVLDERVRHAHGVWHLFVLGGSIAHYISIIGYVGI